MRFRQSILAAAVLSAIAASANAQDVLLQTQEDIRSALAAPGTENQLVIENTAGNVIYLSDTEDEVTFDGGDKNVTFGGDYTGPGGGEGGNGGGVFHLIGAKGGVSFENFKSLTFEAVDKNDPKVLLILANETNFGTQDKAIGTLTFDHADLTNWTSGSVTANVYADQFVMTGDASIGNMVLNIRDTGAEAQTTSFQGNLNIWNGTLAVEGGKFKVEGSLQVSQDKEASLKLGSAEDALSAVTVGSEIKVINGAQAQIHAAGLTAGSMFVGYGSDAEIHADEAVVNGDIMINNGSDSDSETSAVFSGGSLNVGGIVHNVGGKLTFGDAEHALESLIVGTAESNQKIQTSQGAVTNVDVGHFELNGQLMVENEGSQNNIAADTAVVNGNVTLAQGTQTSFSGGTLNINGVVSNDGGQLSLGSEEDSLGTVVVETTSADDYDRRGLHTVKNGQTQVHAQSFELKGGQLFADAGGVNTITAVSSLIQSSGTDDYAILGSAVFKDTGNADQNLTVESDTFAVLSDNWVVENGSLQVKGTAQVQAGGKFVLGTEDKALSSVSFDVSNTPGARFSLRSNGGDVGIYADNVRIIAGEGKTALGAFTNQTSDNSGTPGKIVVSASDTLEIQGRIRAGADEWQSGEAPIETASSIDIEGARTTIIRSDVQTFNKGGTNNVVNIHLNGAQSSFVGTVTDYREDGAQAGGTTLTLENGASWTAAGDSTVTNVTLDGGTIDGTKGDVHSGTFNGQGRFVSSAAVDANGRIDTTTLSADKTGDNAHVDVSFDNSITADDIAGREGEITSAVDGVAATYHVGEGDLYDAYTADVAADGTTTSSSGMQTSGKLESFKGVNAAALVQWRNQVNHLTKRLGDVRRQQGDIGAWARVYGGKYEWSDANEVEMTSTTIQAGGDARVGDWIVGGALSYSDSRFDLDNGDGDGDLYSLAIYGTRMFEKGSYIDFVARYGYIKNDIKAGNMDVDFDSNAFGLSVETGHTFKFMERAYIEPQIEISYGFAQGDDAQASNGVKIEQDDFQNLVTRVGVRTGFEFPEDAGTFYAHLSYSYDFLGDADGTATKGSYRPVSLDEDLGGGWVTYGIGGQFRLGQSTYAYGELERSSGGDVENPWAFNLGLRHLF